MAWGSGGRSRRWVGGLFALVAVSAVAWGGRVAGLWTLPGLDDPAPPEEDLPLSTKAPPGARRLAPFVGGPVLVRLPSVTEDRPGTLLGDVNGTLAEKHAYRVRVPYALARIPKAGETRGNLAAGGRGVAQPLSDRDREIAETLGPDLAAHGLLIVGLDIIGDNLTEVNVTSPTCMREILDQTGFSVPAMVLDALEDGWPQRR